MTKRMILCAVCVLLTLCVLPAMAENLPVYSLYGLTDNGIELLGSGVLFMDNNILLTTMPDRPDVYMLHATYENDLEIILESRSVAGMFQLLRMQEASPLTPMTLADSADAVCVGLLEDGTPTQCQPADLESVLYGSHALPAMQMTLPDGLLPGAFLTDGEHVCGVVLEDGESGDGRKTALMADTLYDLMTESLPAFAYPWLSDRVDITQDGSTLVIDWSHVEELAQAGEDDKVWLLVKAESNFFYDTYGCEISEGSCRITVAPANTYMVWAYVGPELPDLSQLGNVYIPFYVELSGLYNDFNYQDLLFYAGVTPLDKIPENGEMTEEPNVYTAHMLNTSHLWMQSVATYQVTDPVALDGSMVLITPEGYVFANVLHCMLWPEQQEHAVNAVSLDGMLEDYVMLCGDFAPGVYTLAYFFGDQLVSANTFTVE